jgi:hypothetical protein
MENMTKTKFGVIIAVAFFIGIGFGGAGKTQTIEKEVVKEVPVEKTVEVEKNGDEWRKLKSIDDEGFIVAGEAMQLCSAGYYAISNGDVNTLEAVTAETKTKTTKMLQLGAERQKVLKTLGY